MNTARFILNLETATDICSVALFKNNECLDWIESSEPNIHSKYTLIYIRQLLENNQLKTTDLDAVAVTSGPGSYTGLRIGASTAKALAYANDIPLISVPTLQILQKSAESLQQEKSAYTIAMIDAKRMEVYMQIYDVSGKAISQPQAQIVEAQTFADLLTTHPVVFCGNGMPKCQTLLSSFSQAYFGVSQTSAKYMGELAFEKYQHQQFENVAYFEPFYLKNFIAGKPKVKGLYE